MDLNPCNSHTPFYLQPLMQNLSNLCSFFVDMIAIPDFAAGAMENWGLITYRARALLYKEDASSISNKFYVASVVSHELAHQVR